jgi:hypothetical protein
MRGQHLGLDIEIGQLALDQARGEFQGFGRRQVGRIVRGLGQQVQGRQCAARGIEEQRRLALLLGARDGLGCRRHRAFDRLDAQRRQGAFLDLAPLGFDHDFALLGHGAAMAPVLPVVPKGTRADPGTFHQQAAPFSDDQPRGAGKQAEADHDQHQQDQGAAGVAEELRDMAADFVAEHPARGQRQGRLQTPETHGLEAATRHQQYDEPCQRDQQRAAVATEQVAQSMVAPGQQYEEQRHPPPGGKAEEVKQQVGEPGAEAPARVGDAVHHGGMRPARIATLETPEDEGEIKARQPDQQPACLMHQQGDFLGQRGRGGFGCADSTHGGWPVRA